MRLSIRSLSIIISGFIILLIGGLGFGSCGGNGTASLRIMHASPDAPPVDVLIDDQVVLSEVPYKNASQFLEVEAGSHHIKVNAAETSNTVIETDIDLTQDSLTTILAVDFLSQIDALVLPDTDYPADGPALKIRVLHGSPSASVVDVYVTAPGEDISTLNPTVESLAFLEFTDFLEIPEGSYQIRVTPGDSKMTFYDSGEITPKAGSILTAVAVNSTGGPSMIGLVVLTNDPEQPSLELPDRQAQLRVVHASPDAPNVDVLIDQETVLSDVAFRQFNQGYLAVDAGSHNIQVNAAGTSTSVIDTTATFAPGTDYTLLAVNFLTDIEPLLLVDDNTQPPPGKAKVRLIHASPDAPEVDILIDDAVILTNIPFKGSSDFLEVKAGARNFKVNASGTSTPVIDVTPDLEDGGVYTVIALNRLADIEVLLIRTN